MIPYKFLCDAKVFCSIPDLPYTVVGSLVSQITCDKVFLKCQVWSLDCQCRRNNATKFSWSAIYVTGFWKTDQIVILGLFHFIGPANGHTRILHIHSAITRLGGLVCFSRVSFADHVNSWLRQWDPWGALHGRHGFEIHPSVGETSPTPFKHVWAYGWHFWDP